EWFDDAKLGIFIHWGIYSVQGISESWAFFNNYISHPNYMKQLEGFTASAYKPEEWIKLIEESGARYAVVAAKHHDGVALWDSKAADALTTARHAAVRKDVLTPLISALKKSGLKTGIYFSLPDWSHPYYDIHTRIKKRYAIEADPARWPKYVAYYQQQLDELSQQNRPDILWFDGDWEHTTEEWQAPKTLSLLRKYNPDIIVNSRLNHHGDYETPEQGVPVVRPKSRYWELCYTMNDSWGFQPFDTNYKTPNMIVRTLIDCIAMGGNLLLDIGPRADGSIPAEQVAILKELKRWTAKHKEAVYGTRAGLDARFVREKNAFSRDGKTMYVYIDALQKDLIIGGMQTKPKDVRLVGEAGSLNFVYDGYAARVQLPKGKLDSVASVVAIDFDQQPRFELAAVETQPSLASLSGGKDARETIRQIVRWTDSGANLFQNKITEDGEWIDSTISFSNQVRQWLSKHAEVLAFANKGLPTGHYNGFSALSKDRQTLYLFVDG